MSGNRLASLALTRPQEQERPRRDIDARDGVQVPHLQVHLGSPGTLEACRTADSWHLVGLDGGSRKRFEVRRDRFSPCRARQDALRRFGPDLANAARRPDLLPLACGPLRQGLGCTQSTRLVPLPAPPWPAL